jgi:hypothetical protein
MSPENLWESTHRQYPFGELAWKLFNRYLQEYQFQFPLKDRILEYETNKK